MLPAMRLELSKCVLRSFEATDASSLAKNANNRALWINMRDSFPHPYTLADANKWILEKCGYQREGLLRQSAIKDGKIADEALYAKLRDDR